MSCREVGCVHPLVAGITSVQHYNIYHRRTVFVANVWIVRSIQDGLFHCPREGCSTASADAEEIKVHFEGCRVARKSSVVVEGWGVPVTPSSRVERAREGDGSRTLEARDSSPLQRGSPVSTNKVKPSFAPWSQAQDSLLRRLVTESGSLPDWKKIEQEIGRTRCQYRWEERLNADDATYDIRDPKPANGSSVPGAAKSKRARDEIDLARSDDSDDETEIGTKHARVWHGRWKQSETDLLLQLVATTGNDEPDWESIEVQVGRTGCERRFHKIQDQQLERRSLRVNSRRVPAVLRPRGEVEISQRRRGSTSEPEESERTVQPVGSSLVKPLYTPWTAKQTETLTNLASEAEKEGITPEWDKIEQEVGRTNCRSRWRFLQAPGSGLEAFDGVKRRLHRPEWTKRQEEDLRSIASETQDYDEIDWKLAAKKTERTARACRLRWEKIQREGSEEDNLDSSDSSSPSSSTSAVFRSSLPHGPVPSSSSHALASSSHSYGLAPSPSITASLIADQDLRQHPIDWIGTREEDVHPALLSHNAALTEIQRDSASNLARSISLEEHNARVRRARDSIVNADRRISAALDASRIIAAESSSSGIANKEESRGVWDRTPAATPDDLKPVSLPLISLPTASYAMRSLIYLGSDSSSEESD